MERTKRRLFLLDMQSGGSEAVTKLCDDLLIHQIPSAVTPREIRDYTRITSISVITWVWSMQGAGILPTCWTPLLFQTYHKAVGERFTDYVIDTSSLVSSSKRCVKCKTCFDTSRPVFQKSEHMPKVCGKRVWGLLEGVDKRSVCMTTRRKAHIVAQLLSRLPLCCRVETSIGKFTKPFLDMDGLYRQDGVCIFYEYGKSACLRRTG